MGDMNGSGAQQNLVIALPHRDGPELLRVGERVQYQSLHRYLALTRLLEPRLETGEYLLDLNLFIVVLLGLEAIFQLPYFILHVSLFLVPERPLDHLGLLNVPEDQLAVSLAGDHRIVRRHGQ